jgi:hypothetical protein
MIVFSSTVIFSTSSPRQGCRRETEEPAGTIFVSAKPDPIRRRRSEPANNPGTERKLPESRTPIERAGERGREQRVRVGDVEHARRHGARRASSRRTSARGDSRGRCSRLFAPDRM